MNKKRYYLNLPIPPTTNHYHVPRKGQKGLTKSSAVRAYQRDVILLIRSMGLHKENISQPVRLSLTFRPPTRRKYDVSNFLKALEDGLVKGGLLEDDHWIEYDSINKGEPSGGAGFVEVTVRV